MQNQFGHIIASSYLEALSRQILEQPFLRLGGVPTKFKNRQISKTSASISFESKMQISEDFKHPCPLTQPTIVKLPH
jgi:hypothetical protein